jgi:hypothetical protein
LRPLGVLSITVRKHAPKPTFRNYSPMTPKCPDCVKTLKIGVDEKLSPTND